MKIRRPWLIKAIGFFGALVFRLWMGTLQIRYRALGPDVSPKQPGLRGRYIYAFWHENFLLPAYFFGRRQIHVLISQHADGELIAQVCRHMRFDYIRGSTTRGGAEAVRNMLRAGGGAHLAIIPDGPRGPRRRVQQGVIYLSARTGLPIVACGVGYHKPWRASSWDRFAVPKPFSLGVAVVAKPIVIPADVSKESIDGYCRQVEEAFREASEKAERWAETGKAPMKN